MNTGWLNIVVTRHKGVVTLIVNGQTIPPDQHDRYVTFSSEGITAWTRDARSSAR